MDLRKPPMETVYTPLAQGHEPLPRVVIALRTAGDVMSLVAPMRSEVHTASKSIAIQYVRSMPDQIIGMLLNERLLARLSAFFAILATVLACVGLYGVMAYTVARRTREIGLRLALGATIPRLRWLVLRQALFVSVAGLIAGISMAACASGYLEELLFRVEARSPLTYLGVAALLFVASAVAAYLPARAASCINPTAALRVE
jgi:ABC-type antimicrobial peptide transport system permease subunit